jgi:hypothetical protein
MSWARQTEVGSSSRLRGHRCKGTVARSGMTGLEHYVLFTVVAVHSLNGMVREEALGRNEAALSAWDHCRQLWRFLTLSQRQ